MDKKVALNIVLNYCDVMVEDGIGGTILEEAVNTLREKSDERRNSTDDTNE